MQLRWAGWVACGVLAAVTGCTPTVTALPSRGGPAWTEVTSAHFTVWTDDTPKHGRELVREFERRRQIVARALNHAPARERVFVIALRTAWEAAAYLPDQVAGMALPTNPSLRPAIVISAQDDGHDHVVSHELTHVVSHGIVRHQPAWLAEGIATFFETGDLASDARSVVVGIPRVDRVALAHAGELMPLRELFACHHLGCMDGRYYATAWALYSFLYNKHFDALDRYLRRLDGNDDDDEKAWSEVFADPLEAFDVALASWLAHDELALVRIKIEPTPSESTERPLGDGDVLAARGLMMLTVKGDTAGALAQITAAVAADRTNVLARLVARRLEQPLSVEDARTIATAHPEDWRAWWLVGNATTDDEEVDQARQRICQLAPDEAPLCIAAQ
jgi:hypothetical protein